MSQQFVGTVKKIFTRNNGFISVCVAQEGSGEEVWFGAGKYAPSCSEGDSIKFDYDVNGQWNNMVTKSVKVVSKPTGGSGPAAPSPRSGRAYDDRQDSIMMQSANEYASRFLAVAIAADAVSLPAQKAKKFDALKALHAELQYEFYARSKDPQDYINASFGAEPTPEDEPDY